LANLLTALALLTAVVSVVVAHGDRERTPGLINEAYVRDTTQHSTPFVNTIDASIGDVVEYQLQAIAVGSAGVSNVTIALTRPPTWGATYISGSCRIRVPPAAFRRCSDELEEADLHAGALRPGQRLEVRARYRVEQPPCETDALPQSMTADSVETAVTGVAETSVRYDALPALPRCGSALADLLAVVPSPTRRDCDDWRGYRNPVTARVACWPDGPTKYVVYEQYGSPEAAHRAYGAAIANQPAQACGRHPKGSGSYTGPGGGYLFHCSIDWKGHAYLVWLDRGNHVVGYVSRTDADMDHLLWWWRVRA
jgi:hypothetical protein